MTSIAAPDRVRSGWARAHGIDGFDGAEGDADFAALAAELSVTEIASTATEGRRAPARRAGARARGGADPAERRRLPTRVGRARSAVGPARSSPGCGPTSPTACRAGARLVADARVERVVIEARPGRGRRGDGRLGAALGPGPGGGRPIDRASAPRGPGAAGRPGGGRAPDAGRSSSGRGSTHRGPRAVPAAPARVGRRRHLPGADRDVAADRCRPRARWPFVDGVRGRNGYAIESAPGHPGLIASRCRGTARDAYAALMAPVGHLAPLIAITRDGGTGRVRARRRRAAPGSTTGSTGSAWRRSATDS